jgi:hypothetical protein
VGNLPSDRAITKVEGKMARLQIGTKYVVGVGGVEDGKPKIRGEGRAIIDFLPSAWTVAGKASRADGLISLFWDGKIPSLQPAYTMEE